MSIVSHHVKHAAAVYERGGNPIVAEWLKQAAEDIRVHGEPCARLDVCDPSDLLCPHLRLAIKMADDVMGVVTR